MRLEALPFVFRQERFSPDDVDDAVRFLIAIGDTGRNSIESIDIPWKSPADSEFFRWRRKPEPADIPLALPILHAERLVQLLRSCKRLRRISLRFEPDDLNAITIGEFFSDPGIAGLCSLQNIQRANVGGPTYYWPLFEDYPLVARTLMERIEDPAWC